MSPAAGWATRPAVEPASLAWARQCYGVVMSGDRRIVVRAERIRSEVRCTAVSSDDPSFAADVARGVPVASCLTARESFVRWLEAPLAAPAKARRVLPTLLDIQLPFALEDCTYMFLRVGRTIRQTTRALAVAARRADVSRKLAELAASGLNPQVLDHEGLAIWTQSLAEMPPDAARAGALRAVVHLADSHSTLVLGRGEELLSVHVIRGAVAAGVISRLLRTETKSAGIGGTDSSAAVDVTWVWTGPGARESRAVADLHGPLSVEWPGPSRIHTDPESFLARAVASRALLSGDLRCNLRQDEWMHPAEVSRRNRQTTRSVAALLSAGALLCAVSLAIQALTGARVTELNGSFETLRDKLMGYKFEAKGQKAITAVRNKLQKDTRNLQPFARLVRPRLAEHTVAIANICQANGLHLDLLSMGADGVSISGTALDWKDCDALVRYLGQAGYKVSLDRRPVGSDGRIPFVIASGGAHE